MLKVYNKDNGRTDVMVVVVNFEHISHNVLLFLLITLNKQITDRKISNDKDIQLSLT